MTTRERASPESSPATRPLPIRLLFAIDEMEVGGTQRQIVHLARGLDRERFSVEVVYFRVASFLVEELASLGVPVHVCPKQGRVDPSFLLALRRMLRDGRYDLVHAFSFSSELWCAIALATLTGGPRPVFFSSVRGTYEWYTRTQWRLKTWVSGRSSAVIANSNAGARHAASRIGVAKDRMLIVHNGLPSPAPTAFDPALRDGTRATLAVPGDTTLLLFVGRLVEEKNVATLLDALALLRAGTPWRLAIAGDGPLRASLQAQADRLAISDAVTWLGERRDVPALMLASDIVVLPSWREGLSNVILEAMFMARPVVASRAGGNEEAIVGGVTGLVFDPSDAPGLAAALARLIDDPATAQQLGRAGRERADEHFSLAALAQRMATHYLHALDRGVCR